MSKITLIDWPGSTTAKTVMFGERNAIGDFIMGDDGFWEFYAELHGGSWNEYSLRLIADKLQELNAPWNAHIEEYFKNEKESEL